MCLVILRKKTYFFACCLSLSSSLLSLSFLHKNEHEELWLLSPCISLWMCHSTREWIRLSLDTVGPGTDFAGVLTGIHCIPSGMESWCVVEHEDFSRNAYFLPVHWNNQWVNQYKIFCQIIVFRQMLCFNCRCLIVSKKIKKWTNELSEACSRLFCKKKFLMHLNPEHWNCSSYQKLMLLFLTLKGIICRGLKLLVIVDFVA